MKSIEKVAVVHDWLTGRRGGELVLEAILDIFPEADLFTLLYNPGTLSEKIENRVIKTSFIDKLPLKATRYRHYLPLFPTAIEQLDFNGYDLIVSSSHCVARGIIPPPGVPHICYFHSPMRYVWDMYHQYFPGTSALNRWVIPFFANYLRMWDVSAAPRVDSYVCNSSFVADRIRRYYGRDAAVVFPPSVPDRHHVPARKSEGDFYLIVSAFAPYKRIDLAIEAFASLGRKLMIVGGGQEEKKLRKKYADVSNIQFRGHVERETILRFYQTARALIFPGVEDFGIVPVEAQSWGCPVIAFDGGGARETVIPDKTGVLFSEQTPESLREAVLRHEKMKYKREDFQRSVKRFTEGKFASGFRREITKLLQSYRVRLKKDTASGS